MGRWLTKYNRVNQQKKMCAIPGELLGDGHMPPVHVSTIRDNLGATCLCGVGHQWNCLLLNKLTNLNWIRILA